MTVSERVAYIKGLAEGLGIDGSSKEGKLLNVIIEALEDIAFELEDLNDVTLELSNGLDVVSEDLGDVEEFLFGDEDYDCCDDDDDCDCGCCDCDCDDEDYEFEVTCPVCEAEIVLTEEDLDQDAIQCPNCGEKLEFEFDEEDEEDED